VADPTENRYPGKGHHWADFLHCRAITIDALHKSGESDEAIAKILSMDPVQVRLIRTRDRSIPS
jgi:hypothetical protein